MAYGALWVIVGIQQVMLFKDGMASVAVDHLELPDVVFVEYIVDGILDLLLGEHIVDNILNMLWVNFTSIHSHYHGECIAHIMTLLHQCDHLSSDGIVIRCFA